MKCRNNIYFCLPHDSGPSPRCSVPYQFGTRTELHLNVHPRLSKGRVVYLALRSVSHQLVRPTLVANPAPLSNHIPERQLLQSIPGVASFAEAQNTAFEICTFVHPPKASLCTLQVNGRTLQTDRDANPSPTRRTVAGHFGTRTHRRATVPSCYLASSEHREENHGSGMALVSVPCAPNRYVHHQNPSEPGKRTCEHAVPLTSERD